MFSLTCQSTCPWLVLWLSDRTWLHLRPCACICNWSRRRQWPRRDPSWEESPRGKLQSLPEALGHLSSILTREEQEGPGGARRGRRADTGAPDGHLTPPPTLGAQIHFPPGSNKKQSWERGRKWQGVSFVDNEKQKVKEGLCLLGISLVSSWGLISLNLFHYPQGCFFLLMERKVLISRAGPGRQDITVPYLPDEQPALPAQQP